MEKALTKEQQELVEKNHNLIYEFAKKKNLVLDEYYGILAIGLCKAASVYDEDKGKFSTIAYCCMNNKLNEHYRYINKQCAIPESKIFSYDIQLTDDESCSTFVDMIADDYCIHEDVMSKMMSRSILSTLSDTEKIICNYLIDGMKQSEIADLLGCSRQNIGHYVQQIRKKVSKNYS